MEGYFIILKSFKETKVVSYLNQVLTLVSYIGFLDEILTYSSL